MIHLWTLLEGVDDTARASEFLKVHTLTWSKVMEHACLEDFYAWFQMPWPYIGANRPRHSRRTRP